MGEEEGGSAGGREPLARGGAEGRLELLEGLECFGTDGVVETRLVRRELDPVRVPHVLRRNLVHSTLTRLGLSPGSDHELTRVVLVPGSGQGLG